MYGHVLWGATVIVGDVFMTSSDVIRNKNTNKQLINELIYQCKTTTSVIENSDVTFLEKFGGPKKGRLVL